MEPEIFETEHRQAVLLGEIHRLESVLAQSPDDAFGYLELGCLFAEADRREAAIEAFRQSYVHRTGGIDVASAALPVVDVQLQEAFDVAVAQVPGRTRGHTRELFELAVQKERQAEAHPLRHLGGPLLVVVMVLAAMMGATGPETVQGYWPSVGVQQTAWHVPPNSGGYWPSDVTHW